MENGVTLLVNGGEDGYEALEIEGNNGGNIGKRCGSGQAGWSMGREST